MKHPGPAQVYVSLAPVAALQGPSRGPRPAVRRLVHVRREQDRVRGARDLPDGEYLVRAEHIAIHGAHDGKAEFYYSCAQVRIQGSNATALPTGAETAKIPGVYKTDDAAINFSVWGGKTSYPLIPGIAVAPGGTVRGSADGKSKAIVKVAGGSSGTSPAPVPAVSAAAASSSSSTAAASTAAATTPAATAPASTLATSVVASSTAATTTATTAEAVTTATSTASTLPPPSPSHRARRPCLQGWSPWPPPPLPRSFPRLRSHRRKQRTKFRSIFY
ncbi:hypothetical protein MCOR02_007846 [Pyricularia oryzae]|nr:hypothetical protein MCOR02_007846 [Pyricularia oryzae]